VPCVPKVKVKLSLCLIKHYAMEMYGASGNILISSLDRGEWSASGSDCFTPGEEPPIPIV
jgi:hypothetical protein